MEEQEKKVDRNGVSEVYERGGAADDQTDPRTFDTSGPSSTAVSTRQRPGLRRNFIVSSKLPSVRPFYGIVQDIRSRAPYYASDWTDAWNYRVIPATLLIFFAK